MSVSPIISVIIPAFNRVEPLKYTLRSVARAAMTLGEPAETLLIDDGSTPPLTEQLADFDAATPVTTVRQANQGSIVARLTGLRAARGEFVLFLDSDDLVHPEKFRRQIDAMRTTGAEVSYSDMALVTLGPDYTVADFAPASVLGRATTPADFYLRIQPAPHVPIYRRNYLDVALTTLVVPVSREMDPVGDVWLYYNLAPHPARIVKVDGPLNAICAHDEDRYSRHWERLGVAALQVMEGFFERCPVTSATLAARQQAGECAFESWRRLPRDFDDNYDARTLNLWRKAPRGPLRRLGGSGFRLLAHVLGPELAGRLLRQLKSGRYVDCATLSSVELQSLLEALRAGK